MDKEPPRRDSEFTTTAEEPSTGLSACTRLLDVLVGHVLTGRGNWSLRIRRAGPHGSGWTPFLREVEDLRGALSELADDSTLSPSVDAQIHPHEPGAFMTPGCDSLYAVTCLSVGIHLPNLFLKGGPLFDPALVAPDGKLRSGVLGGGRMQRALQFAVEHARQFVFPPSAVLASYGKVYLFFLITTPTSLLEREKARIERVQSQLARIVHAGHARKIGSWIPLPLACSKGGKRGVAALLLWARKDIVYDLEKLDGWTRTLEEREDVDAVTGSSRKRSKGGAPEMRLRTLMDGYQLADLDLPAAMRQLVAAGRCPGEVMVLDEVPLLVEVMARSGYGFEDVRLVLADSRFPLSFEVRFIDTSLRHGLALRFRKALDGVNRACTARLPYGITSIVLLADGDDRTVDRYVVMGGTKASPFQIEVSHDLLISARRFHRALSSHLKSFPYRVPQEVWEEIVLRRGLSDPRICLRRPGPGKAEVPLVERIGRFAAEAKPLEPWLWESGNPIPWPILRDGQVVFRLSALRDWLAREIEGPAPSRSEVAAAVRAAGGAPYGAMRFGRRVIRVWTLPYAGRTRTPAPGRGRAPA